MFVKQRKVGVENYEGTTIKKIIYGKLGTSHSTQYIAQGIEST